MNTVSNPTARCGQAVQRLLGETERMIAAAQVPGLATTGSRTLGLRTPDAAAPMAFNDYGDGAPYWMGTASTMHHDDQPTDPVAELHKIVEEITGKPVEKRPKQRMGFL